MKIRALLILLLFFPAFYSTGTGPVATIPFDFDHSRMVVHMRINDSPKILRMLFDTGADGVGLKKSVADEIGVVENRKQNAQVVGASVQIGISEKNTLVFDSLKIPGQNIGIFPNYADSLDGLFGSAFLRNFVTYLNFEESVIELYKPGEKPWDDTFKPVPLRYTGLPQIRAGIRLNNGKELESNLVFDTGAHYSLILFGGCVVRNNLEENFAIQSRATTTSMGHSTPTVSGLVDFIRFEKVRLEDFTATLQTATQNEKKFTEEADGSLGIEIISKFNWYIDLANREYHMKPNKNFGQPMPFWLGDFFLAAFEEKLKVLSVNPLSPGEKRALEPGDIIESMNEESPVKFIQSKKKEYPGKALKNMEIELIVSRGDVQFLETLIIR